jgi:hypothetical protein
MCPFTWLRRCRLNGRVSALPTGRADVNRRWLILAGDCRVMRIGLLLLLLSGAEVLEAAQRGGPMMGPAVAESRGGPTRPSPKVLSLTISGERATDIRSMSRVLIQVGAEGAGPAHEIVLRTIVRVTAVTPADSVVRVVALLHPVHDRAVIDAAASGVPLRVRNALRAQAVRDVPIYRDSPVKLQCHGDDELMLWRAKPSPSPRPPKSRRSRE